MVLYCNSSDFSHASFSLVATNLYAPFLSGRLFALVSSHRLWFWFAAYKLTFNLNISWRNVSITRSLAHTHINCLASRDDDKHCNDGIATSNLARSLDQEPLHRKCLLSSLFLVVVFRDAFREAADRIRCPMAARAVGRLLNGHADANSDADPETSIVAHPVHSTTHSIFTLRIRFRSTSS